MALQQRKIKVVSSDLNGTLVRQHTMKDMLRLHSSKDRYQRACEFFQKQTAGKLSMEGAFYGVAPFYEGLSLRQAIEYTEHHMEYIKGFPEFVDSLRQKGVYLVINSTSFSVTIHAMRAQIGKDKIHGFIGNILQFGMEGKSSQALSDDELESRVRDYFTDLKARKGEDYDRIRATGRIVLGIRDERKKAKLLLDYVDKHFSGIKPEQIAHLGDTIGDSEGIVGIAREGGIGIAFNYNGPLERYLNRVLENGDVKKENILFIDAEREGKANLRHVLKELGYK